MFKLSKTTDYGIVLMAQLASGEPASPTRRESQNARELAEAADLPVPMVSKILKALAKEGLLHSHRGAKGGYSLARKPEDLPVSEMIRVLEGPVALTDCAIGPARCEHETLCAVREPWQQISRVVEQALADVTLADLVRGKSGRRVRASANRQSLRDESARDINRDIDEQAATGEGRARLNGSSAGASSPMLQIDRGEANAEKSGVPGTSTREISAQ